MRMMREVKAISAYVRYLQCRLVVCWVSYVRRPAGPSFLLSLLPTACLPWPASLPSGTAQNSCPQHVSAVSERVCVSTPEAPVQ